MIRHIIALALALIMGIAAGCSTESDLGGVRIPNSRPDTEITGQPPSLLEAGFVCEFNWKGSDSDGKVVGFQWKISNNGNDGISPRDTMTVDPISGAVINPWRYTTANDSLFYVLADQNSFPGDPVDDPRSFRTHTLFIRAVDDKGAIDPSPAHMSFTSTTLVPTCRVVFPGLGGVNVKAVPPTLNIGWEGYDADFEMSVPVKARFLWVPALVPGMTREDGDYALIQIKSTYDQYKDELIDFYDPNWSEWIPYKDIASERLASFPDLPNLHTFLFAVQVQDTAGAVSIGKNYQIEVGNVKVSSTLFIPEVTLTERYLMTYSGVESQLASGQPLYFTWVADASSYNGSIVSFQHGWNVTNPDLTTDAGWSIQPGLSAQNRESVERSFTGGLNYFFLKVIDDSKREVLFKWTLDVVPFVPYVDQQPLLLIDQVIDDNVGGWVDPSGNARDQEDYRNAYWEFLEGSDGVSGFSWENDQIDHAGDPGEGTYADLTDYSKLVDYKCVMIYAKNKDGQYMMEQFKAVANVDRFVYLTPYQQKGGNLFLVGGGSLDSFIEDRANYYVPTIFDSREGPLDGYLTSFGTKVQPDGTVVARGPLMYHYTTAGISALDWTAHNIKTVYGEDVKASRSRSASCVGLKQLYLDDDFKVQNLIGPGVLADTISTNPDIDWIDRRDQAMGTLELSTDYQFFVDEFVNANISPRSVALIEQECGQGPGGLCIEPMFRGIARFDWMREIRWAEGETGWPYTSYTPTELKDDICGKMALSMMGSIPDGTARTNGKVFGWMSYKTVADKESGKPDVYWGFDPYRFDKENTQQAIRWVLQNFGLSLN